MIDTHKQCSTIPRRVNCVLQMHFLITALDHPSIINHNMCITQMCIIKSLLEATKRQPNIWIPAKQTQTEHVKAMQRKTSQMYIRTFFFTWLESNTVASLVHLMARRFSHCPLLSLPYKRNSQGSKSALHQLMLLPKKYSAKNQIGQLTSQTIWINSESKIILIIFYFKNPQKNCKFLDL